MKQVNSLFTARKSVLDRASDFELVESAEFGGSQVDVYRQGEEVFMTAKQLGEVLEYKHPQRSIDKFIESNEYLQNKGFSVKTGLVSTDGKTYNTRLLTEDGIYEITMLSKQPKAQEFRFFIRELLKGLRKGSLKVVPSHEIEDPLERAKQWIKEEEKRRKLEVANERMKPYAVLGESVSDNDALITIGELAKIMKQRGIDIGQNRLYEWLRQSGYLIKRKGSTYNLPTQRSLDMKLLHVVKREINKGGEVAIARTTKVTGKGQVYFLKKMVELDHRAGQYNLTLFDS